MSGPSVDRVWETTPQLNSLDCWDYSVELACLQGPEDLQLAAQLGKTLLERNKELETCLQSHQTNIEEQAQEIQYLKKQNAALREATESRLKIYEQLEVGIQDLERANHRLVVESTSNKKTIKSQCQTIENLEAKCEELQKTIDELKVYNDSLLRQQQQQHMNGQSNGNEAQPVGTGKGPVSHDGSITQIAAKSPIKSLTVPVTDDSLRKLNNTDENEVTQLLQQLQEIRNQRARDQKTILELRQQVESILKDYRSLEDQLNELRNKEQDMKNLQDEINTLEEVRQGKLCGRCLRGYDSQTQDELSSMMLDAEEDDDISLAESYLNSQRECEISLEETDNESKITHEQDTKNPYRDLCEKYAALLEVQRQPTAAIRKKSTTPTPCMSLQEELKMSGDFNTFQNIPSDQQDIHNHKMSNGFHNRFGYDKKLNSVTPTDFSEAETLSSGFTDETSNKATQTDIARPGSLLCSIADGEDCKFSIYDDNSPFESRFRKTPEYRHLFSEIFSVLKRAAEAKDEGEKFPLINNNSTTTTPTAAADTIKMISEEQEDLGDLTDDNQSVLSSVISSVVSEPVIRVHTPTPEKRIISHEHTSNAHGDKHGETLTTSISTIRHTSSSQRRHQLDYLSIQVRKKNSAKKNNHKKFLCNDLPTTPDVIPTTNPKFLQSKSASGGRRNKYRPLTFGEQDGTHWNGNTIHIFPSKNSSRDSRPHPKHNSSGISPNNYNGNQHMTFEYKDYKPSSASEEVAKLRRLEMSYAEALRTPNKSKANHNRRH